jgi:predicted DNA-binding transcriptional regulator AlpA
MTRLLKRAEAASYCGVSAQTFTNWVNRRILPDAIPGTNRWDIKAIDAALDGYAGITTQSEQKSALEIWRMKREAHAQRSLQGQF